MSVDDALYLAAGGLFALMGLFGLLFTRPTEWYLERSVKTVNDAMVRAGASGLSGHYERHKALIRYGGSAGFLIIGIALCVLTVAQ